VRPFFKDEAFDFATLNALGAAFHGATDVGEVLATIEHVRNGKSQTWVDAWSATAGRLATAAGADADAGRVRSAAARYLRAAYYYSTASEQADGTGDPDLFASLWGQGADAWERWVDLTDVDVERIEIPYEDTTLAGWFFRSGPAGEPRRTLIHNNGSDGPVVDCWVRGVADALARGWNAMTFDGPGQNSALVRQKLPFRPDWEHVVTPVVDHLLTRPDVAPERLALMGVSQGGYWVPRAVAFEHRIAAAVADPGVVDVSEAMLRQLPHSMAKLLDSGEREKFDKEMRWAYRVSPAMRGMLAWRMRPYGTTSEYDFFTAARSYALTDEVIAGIRCPMLVTDPEHEQFWPGQPQRLYDALACPKEIVAFTEAEGADRHCEPAANGVRGERIFDWLDTVVPA
jgi:hypothetical protein